MSDVQMQVFSEKTFIVNITETKESGWITQGEYEHSLQHHEWIPMVQNFVDWWGERIVINDVHVALSGIE